MEQQQQQEQQQQLDEPGWQDTGSEMAEDDEEQEQQEQALDQTAADVAAPGDEQQQQGQQRRRQRQWRIPNPLGQAQGFRLLRAVVAAGRQGDGGGNAVQLGARDRRLLRALVEAGTGGGGGGGEEYPTDDDNDDDDDDGDDDDIDDDAGRGSSASVMSSGDSGLGSGDERDAASDDGPGAAPAGPLAAAASEEQQQEQPHSSHHDRRRRRQADAVAVDADAVSRHSYLGDVDDLAASAGSVLGLLPEGTVARLPLLLLPEVVLFPGRQLPLLLTEPHERRVLERALAAPPPFARLLAVLPGACYAGVGGGARALPVVCTAEVRQLRQGLGPDGAATVAALATGRQRGELVFPRGAPPTLAKARVRILPEGSTSAVPRAIRAWSSAVAPPLARPWDLSLLSRLVREKLAAAVGGSPAAAGGFAGSAPLELSYMAASALPLPQRARAELLAADSAAERLLMLLRLLSRADDGALGCAACGRGVARRGDALPLTAEGAGGAFVNAHGHVHELATFSRVRPGALALMGRPETEFSWFPGYAWTCCCCIGCRAHLGWRFTAAEGGRRLVPQVFFGLRRSALRAGGGGGGGGRRRQAGVGRAFWSEGEEDDD